MKVMRLTPDNGAREDRTALILNNKTEKLVMYLLLRYSGRILEDSHITSSLTITTTELREMLYSVTPMYDEYRRIVSRRTPGPSDSEVARERLFGPPRS